jgi:hypothetical protein
MKAKFGPEYEISFYPSIIDPRTHGDTSYRQRVVQLLASLLVYRSEVVVPEAEN